MSANLLLDPGNVKVLIGDLEVGLHLLERLVGDGVDTELLLTLGEAEPELAPCRVTRPLAEETGHLLAAVAARQRRLVRVERGNHLVFGSFVTAIFGMAGW
jgi:hypothetical protein